MSLEIGVHCGNKFTKEYFDDYHLHIPKAQPEADYDNRNALYALQVA